MKLVEKYVWFKVKAKENLRKVMLDEKGLGVIEIVIIIIILIGLALLFQKEILALMNQLLGRMGTEMNAIQPKVN